MLKMLYPEERMVKEEWIMARAKDAIINEYADFSNISWGDDEVEKKCKKEGEKALRVWEAEYGTLNVDTARQYLEDIGYATFEKEN